MTKHDIPNFADLLLIFQSNVTPGMLTDFAKSLNIPVEAFQGSDIGFYPKEQCWVIPEYDGNGNVIGLLRRYSDGKKFTWPGSKRGCNYDPVGIRSKDQDLPEYRPQFIRVSERDEICCPICGKFDWCLVSSDDPQDPSAVICPRIPTGATRLIEGCGYLHQRHTQSDFGGRASSILPPSDKPVVVTEGWSDRMYAKGMGYVAISRPSAESCPKGLSGLIQGRDVILVGDRDGRGVGQRGLESTFQTLRPAARSIVKVLPAEGRGKDLRAYAPTAEEFAQHVAATGNKTDDGSIMADTCPLTLVKSWLQETKMRDGVRLLQRVHGDYYHWEGNVYRKMAQEEVRGEWYAFFADKQVKTKTGNDIKITTLRPDRKFCADLQDAASAYCSVRVEDGIHEPFLIKARAPMDLARAVVFQNGILYVADDRLAQLTPDVFLTSTLPYEYNPKWTCPLWEWFVGDVFKADLECIALLQEWFGYNLIASNHMQAMMFFWGRPGSGKSTTAEVLRALLGKARCAAADTENFKSAVGKMKLVNKYAAIMQESRETNHAEIDKILQTWKAITGGDTTNVRALYKDYCDVTLFCRLTYVANEALPFDDVSQAMANRMNLLYFSHEDYRKNNPDRMLEHKLIQELPGIALWAIEGLKRLLANDKFTIPTESRVHLAQLAELTNPVGVMLEECTRTHIGSEFLDHRTECNTLYDLWKAYCDETRTKTSLSMIGFGMKLAHLERPIVRRRIEEAGKRMYVYQGLSIRPEAMKRYLQR